MRRSTTSRLAQASAAELNAAVQDAWVEVGESFEQFCLIAGLSSLTQMLEEDAATLAGERYDRVPDRPGYRWGSTRGKLGFHGGKVEVERPRVRSRVTGKEMALLLRPRVS